MLATDYPLLEIFWTILIFFGFVVLALDSVHRVSQTSSAEATSGGWGKAAVDRVRRDHPVARSPSFTYSPSTTA